MLNLKLLASRTVPVALDWLLLFFAVTISTDHLAEGQQPPTPEELIQNWVSWTNQLYKIDPVHIMYEVSGMGQKSSFRSELTTRARYFVSQRYIASHTTLKRIVGVPGSEPDTFVSFSRYDAKPNSVILSRLPGSSGYFFNESTEEEKVATRLPVEILALPWETSADDETAAQYAKFEILSPAQDHDSAITIKFINENPTEDGVGMIPFTSVVKFSKEHNWLPVSVETEYEFPAGQGRATRRYLYSDWRETEGLKVPFRTECVAIVGGKIIDSDDPYRMQILKFERCSLEEVRKRCQMSFYELPSFPGEQKSWASWANAFYVFMAAMGLFALYLYMRRKQLQ